MQLASLRGKTIVFTGALGSDLPRWKAAEEARRAGAIVARSVTRETDVLVQGAPSANYKFGDFGRKLARVDELRDDGFEVSVISGDEFQDLLVGRPLGRDASRAALKHGLRPAGISYRRAEPPRASAKAPVPFIVDPNARDRALRGHRETQNELADTILRWGFDPLSPTDRQCDYDVGWYEAHAFYVAEVKSISRDNEVLQLRLGLGQVLHYAAVLGDFIKPVRAVLALQHEPSDERWIDICERVGVILTWRPDFARLAVA